MAQGTTFIFQIFVLLLKFYLKKKKKMMTTTNAPIENIFKNDFEKKRKRKQREKATIYT